MGSAAEGGIDVGAVPLEWTRWTRSTGSMSGMVGSVVGIIGTARDGAVSASSIANLIAGCNAFNGGAPDQHAERAGAGSGSSHANGSAGFGDGGSAASAPGAAAADSQVESYYNAKRATLYLNLVCDYEDIVDLASQAGIEVGEISSEMSQAWLEQQDDQMIQKIAFMFSVCHEIVLVMPSTQFEPHWLTLLKVLEGSKKYIKVCFLANLPPSPVSSPSRNPVHDDAASHWCVKYCNISTPCTQDCCTCVSRMKSLFFFLVVSPLFAFLFFSFRLVSLTPIPFIVCFRHSF